eukprot:COSAG05_NODE_2949_length_2474_cov_1.914947_3_plen_317_part_01
MCLDDMLNQNYENSVSGGKICRLAIGSHSRDCEVHPAFRCIVIVDAEVAWNKLPSPLLNRFEKMCLSVHDLLSLRFREIEEVLWTLVRDFAQVACLQPVGHILQSAHHSEEVCQVLRSVFVGFNSSSIASVLLQMQRSSNQLATEQIVASVQRKFLSLAVPEAIINYGVKTAGSRHSLSAPEVWGDVAPSQVYFTEQAHSNLQEVIVSLQKNTTAECIRAVVFTFSSGSVDPRAHIATNICRPTVMNVQDIKSEEFCREQVDKYLLVQNPSDALIVQCEMLNLTSVKIVDKVKQICDEARIEAANFIGDRRKDFYFI